MRHACLILAIMLFGDAGRVARAAAAPTSKPATSRPAPPPKYIVASPEQHAQAIAAARARAAKVAEKLGVKFTEIQTDHFIIFTDWDARESGFLKTNLEGAYAAVSKQFDMSPKDNVFIGKLPVYMYVSHFTFQKHAEAGGAGISSSVAGYYQGSPNGVGELVMWKPVADDKTSLEVAKFQWAHVLTHEFVHAFVARFHNNNRIPVWLNEGTAEVIAGGLFPFQHVNEWARAHASRTADLSNVFDDDMKPADIYPVMQTMVEYLIKRDRRAFIKLFETIKDGTEPQQALRNCYGLDYTSLTSEWRRYAMSR